MYVFLTQLDSRSYLFFFFNDTATTEIYTLSLHDALPIYLGRFGIQFVASPRHADGLLITGPVTENMRLALRKRSEEHTSELQSQSNLVCRLLLERKKKTKIALLWLALCRAAYP